MFFEGPGTPGRPTMRPRWLHVALKLDYDELRRVTIGMRWLKISKIRNKMRQDGPR